MISFTSSFEIISVVMSAPKIFIWIAACIVDVTAVNPYDTKTLLANGLITFLIKDKLVFSNGARSLVRNLPYFTMLGNWVFENFILADELFA